jgi:WD40 repeat protein
MNRRTVISTLCGTLLLTMNGRVPAQEFGYVLEARSLDVGGSIQSLAFAPDGTWLAVVAGKRAVIFALAPNGQLQPRGDAPGLRKPPEAAAVSPDSTTLAVVDRGGGLYLYRYPGGGAPLTPVATIERAHKGKASAVAFTGDGAYVLTGGEDRKVRVWTPAGQPFAELGRGTRHEGEVLAVIPLGNQRQVLSVGKDRRIILWQVDTQQALRSIAVESDVLSAAAGTRGTTLALGLQSLAGNRSAVGSPQAGSRFAPGSPTSAHEIDSDDRVRLIDAASGLELRDLEGEHQDLAAVAVTPDGRFVAAAGSAATATVWDSATGKRLTQIPCERPVSALTFSPDGKWMLVGTRDGTLALFRLHGVQSPQPPKPPQQILLALLEPSGVGDLGDESPPSTGPRDPVPVVNSATLRVRGRIKTSSALKSVLVDGQEITSVTPDGTDGYIFNAYVTLPAAGEHRVEIMVENLQGATARRAFVVERAAKVAIAVPGTGRRLALIVGVSHYAESSINLAYAADDARALYRLLTNPALGPAAFQSADVRLLLDEQATVSSINTGLREFLQQARENDFVLFFFAGHGAADPHRLTDYYLLAHDTSKKNIAGSGLLMRHVREAIADIPARDVLILTDACHSAGIAAPSGRGLPEPNAINQAFLERMRHASGGLAILTASEAAQLSQEDARWGHHGVFTFFLLQGLSGAADRNGDGIITLGELIEYVRENVKRATHDEQIPAIGPNSFDRGLPLMIVAPDAQKSPEPRR